MRQKQLVNTLLIIVYITGIAGLGFDQTRTYIATLTPLILLSGTIAIFYLHRPFTLAFLLFAIIIVITALAVEIAGVKTGKIFGHYSYRGTLGTEIFGTPLIMGVLWLQIVYSAIIIINSITTNYFIKCLTGAAILTIFDFILEPAARLMDWWQWEFNRVPVQNYGAWFALSFFFIMIFDEHAKNTANTPAITLIGLQVLFFLAINIMV